MVTSRPEIVGTFGVVTTTHWLATTTGMTILEQGGNAFDAAVAAGFVLHVVEPDQNGPGGDLPVVLWSADRGRVEVICGQGVAPAAANLDALLGLGLDVMPGTGHLPAVVPGSFGAWMLLLRDYGTMTPRRVLEPAIAIARDGFVLKPDVARLIAGLEPFFAEHWPSSAKVYLPGGDAPAGDALYALPALADTYERIVREAESAGGDRLRQIEAARHAWYEGFVAEAIDRFFRMPVMDTTGDAHTGLLTGHDLAGWRATVEEPVTLGYGDYTVCKPGPWAQSPVLLQQLALLRGFDLASLDPCGAEFVHTVQECAKLAFADRDAFYGDPSFAQVPLDVLLSEPYNAERRRLVAETASLEVRPGAIAGYGGHVQLRLRGSTVIAHPETAMDAETEEPPTRSWADYVALTRGDTCHLDIIDRQGNMVSATPSGGWLSGSPVVPGLGFPVS
ncbi:MAG: gamma-glutamyltranspeptidase / glutathione hydrolase, partial [Gaiellaceae bacterium]|nr:gamma-glutamyltranspeptidase / glutathione hydrolase [Gaiellaceae bacterium]